ncbi:hypothetical protein Lalb_Chr08g0241611 [Lupinus albus]|uniref:Uncharacterized protein n=1 Tax=Lupinus albus TaxID=3870 RepID=A0A6A4Q636_LUPAL|nr:hypothetical protein Lalb_Chr08g0241611 [Lupinus albus]
MCDSFSVAVVVVVVVVSAAVAEFGHSYKLKNLLLTMRVVFLSSEVVGFGHC